MAEVQQKQVDAEENGMRLDRWFKLHFPGVAFGALQKLLRTGQVRVDGGRAKSDFRLMTGQMVRIPPMAVETVDTRPVTMNTIRHRDDLEVLRRMMLHEDAKVIVFNKPAGLAVQGGSGIVRHLDGMLDAMTNSKGEKPRLVHRIDRDTSGVLVVAKTRSAAVFLTKAFRQRTTRKVYWALVKGVPRKAEARLSNYLLRVATEDGDKMTVVPHGTRGAEHAVTFYRVIARSGHQLSWLELMPETGRMHQLRIHCHDMGHPILGDPKYPIDDHNFLFPGGMQKKLHLHARRIDVPHPNGGTLSVTAELPPHMVQSWNLLGLDEHEANRDD